MNISSSLPILIPGEAIFALLLALFFALHQIIRQRRQIKKLLAKFREMKSAYEQSSSETESFYNHKSEPEHRDVIHDYFAQSLSDSLQRYQKHTASEQPYMNANHSYSGKIAALRSIYLAAEKEVFEDRGITHAGWGVFEKKLAGLINWQDKKNSPTQEENESHIHELQEEIVKLKNYQQELEQYQMESQRTINSLHSMLENVKHLQTGSDSNGQLLTYELWGDSTLDKFAGEANKRNQKVLDLLHDLKTFPSQFTESDRKKMEGQLNILEIELMKADQHIGSLTKELKEAKLQVTTFALRLRDVTVAGTTDNIPIHDTHRSLDAEQSERKYFPSEIHQLKEHNKRQHLIINELDQEVQLLRNSLDNDAGDQRNLKEEEIKRLERLIKESQGCINTLESEVDNLYAQLQEKNDQPNEGGDNSEVSEELAMITRELEKTVAHYQQLHAINYMMMDFMKCNSIEHLAKQLVQFIKAFRAPIGFNIKSLLGSAEYFPATYFDDALKALAKGSTLPDSISHLPEGTLFINSRLHVLLLPTLSDDYPILETSLVSLINAAEEGIKRLEYEKLNKKRHHDTHEWTDLTKNLLANLDIQYAYQVEENRKTFNHFIAELRRAYHLLDLHGPGGVVLDNAINEFEERIHGLIKSSEVIDGEISRLLEHMEKSVL